VKPLLVAGLLLLALVTSSPARAQAAPGTLLGDSVRGQDKALHFGVSVALAGGAYLATSPVLSEGWQRAVAGASFALALGVGKEGFDLVSGLGTPSVIDLAYDVFGVATGIGVALAIDAVGFRPAPE